MLFVAALVNSSGVFTEIFPDFTTLNTRVFTVPQTLSTGAFS